MLATEALSRYRYPALLGCPGLGLGCDKVVEDGALTISHCVFLSGVASHW